MKDQIYIIADRSGVARMTKRSPTLARDEIGVRLDISIPDQSFRSPIIRAEICVADDAVIQPSVEVVVTGDSDV